MKYNPLPSLERLKEVLNYDPETGLFAWRIKRGCASAGSVAGCTNCGDGYTEIGIDGRLYKAHRLAFLYVHGVEPPNQIDHRDGNRSNNRIKNLRAASQSENNRNTKIRKDNKSGHKGVTWHRKNKRWRVCLKIGQKQISLGCYERLEDAAKAAAESRATYYGEFANRAA